MNLGISILFRKPEKKAPNLFSFMSPLSFEVPDIFLYVTQSGLHVKRHRAR